jgi:2-polyprenyl-6-methoxyphenol hydroxylase-like FAD-dependent oxidoreductase
MSFKIAILGAGIGGLSAAIALQRAGREVVVYEQSPQFLRQNHNFVPLRERIGERVNNGGQ